MLPLTLLDKIGQLRGKELCRHLGQTAQVFSSEQSIWFLRMSIQLKK